jgi:predicted membrane protein
MAEKKVEELLKKYLGISVPRLIIAILMILFGILILVKSELLGTLISIYLLITGILALVDELRKKGASK